MCLHYALHTLSTQPTPLESSSSTPPIPKQYPDVLSATPLHSTRSTTNGTLYYLHNVAPPRTQSTQAWLSPYPLPPESGNNSLCLRPALSSASHASALRAISLRQNRNQGAQDSAKQSAPASPASTCSSAHPCAGPIQPPSRVGMPSQRVPLRTRALPAPIQRRRLHGPHGRRREKMSSNYCVPRAITLLASPGNLLPLPFSMSVRAPLRQEIAARCPLSHPSYSVPPITLRGRTSTDVILAPPAPEGGLPSLCVPRTRTKTCLSGTYPQSPRYSVASHTSNEDGVRRQP